MLSGGGACIAGARPPSAEAAPPLRLGRKARFLRLVQGGSQLLAARAARAAALERFLDTFVRLLAAAPRRAATSPVPETDPEHTEPGGAGARGMGGAQRWEPTRGARGGGRAERCGRSGVRTPAGVTKLVTPDGSKQRDWKPKWRSTTPCNPRSRRPPLDRTPAAGTRPCEGTPAESTSDPSARSKRSPRRPPRRSSTAPGACSSRRRGRESA